MFNAASLPQFVGSGDGASMLLAAATVYLSVLLAGDIIWAAAAGLAERQLGRLADRRNRISGGILIGASIGPVLSYRSMS